MEYINITTLGSDIYTIFTILTYMNSLKTVIKRSPGYKCRSSFDL